MIYQKKKRKNSQYNNTTQHFHATLTYIKYPYLHHIRTLFHNLIFMLHICRALILKILSFDDCVI